MPGHLGRGVTDCGLVHRRFDLTLLVTTPPYIAHCMGAFSAKGS